MPTKDYPHSLPMPPAVLPAWMTSMPNGFPRKPIMRPSGALYSGPIVWSALRDRVDLVLVANSLIGPADGRRGERGRRLWWRCPFHDDANPSFAIDPGKPWWRCYGCEAHGDAAGLVMRLENLSFPDAVRRLAGELPGRPASKPPARRPGLPSKPAPASQGMGPDAALELVEAAVDRLWTPAGAGALAELRARGLEDATIRAARLGFAPRVEASTRDGRPYTAAGIVLPWFDDDALAMVKVRQPGDRRPKYAEVFRHPSIPPRLYPAPSAVVQDRPAVIVEGEFDALLVGQELGALASVVTAGAASMGRSADGIDPAILGTLVIAPTWLVAHDADAAGDSAAALFEPYPRARRVRPPAGCKDWCELHATGFNRVRYHLGRELPGSASTREELAALRWGPAAPPAT